MISRITLRNIHYFLCFLLFVVTACEKITSLRAQHYFNQAKKYYEEKNYSKAMEACDYALTFDPTLLDALTLKGMIYYQTGSYKNSLEWIRKAVTQKPDDRQLRMILIDALLKAERYEGAINQVLFLLKNSPEDPELIFLYYYAHIKSRNDTLIGKVRNELQTIIMKGCDDPRIHCLVADLEILKGDLSRAKTILLDHYTTHPVWRDTMLRLADIFCSYRDYANVVEIYNKVAEKAEDKKAVMEQLVDVLLKNRQFATAEDILRELYDRYPDDTSVQQKLIECLRATKKFDEAVAIIDSLDKKYSDDIDLKKTKIQILIEKKDLDAALTLTQSVIKEIDSDSPLYIDFKNKIAEIFFLLEKYEDSKKHIREILQIYPKDAQARFLLCKIDFQTSSSVSIALVGELRQLINENPGNADYYYYLGLVHQKRNEEVMADKAFREALEKDPGHKGALLALAEKNFKLGSYNIVDKDIQNYFKIHPDDNETLRILNNMRGMKPGPT